MKFRVFIVQPYGWWAEVEAKDKREARRKAKSGEYEPLDSGNLMDGRIIIKNIVEAK